MAFKNITKNRSSFYLISIFLPICFIFLSILISSCQKRSKPKSNEISLSIPFEPATLDPRKARDLHTINIAINLFEGLFRIGKDEKAHKALVQSYTVSEDGKTYTFILKEAYFSNGEKITAPLIERSMQKTLSPDFPAPLANLMYVIEGAKEVKGNQKERAEIYALDEKSFEIHLTHPTNYFLEILAQPIFFPVPQSFDEKEPTFNPQKELCSFFCSGPFQIECWQKQDKLSLVKNSNYREKEKVALQRINFYQIGSEETVSSMFEAGELDWAGSPFSSISLDLYKNIANVKKASFLQTMFIRLNQKAFEKKFSKKKMGMVKDLLYVTLDQEKICTSVLLSSQLPAYGLLPVPWNLKSKAALQPVVKNDIGLLKNNEPIELKFMYIKKERNHLVAQALQREWDKSSQIKITLEPMEAKLFFEKMKGGKYELALADWVADFRDPVNFLEVFKYAKSGTNNTFWENKEYISLLDQIEMEVDNAKRDYLIEKAHMLLMQEKPLLPLYHGNQIYLVNEKLKGFTFTSLGHLDFKEAYLEE